MHDVGPFGALVAVIAAVGLLAVLSNRLSERIQLPAPALFVAGAAVAAAVIPGLDAPPQRTVERIVTIALAIILFDGGMHIGLSRLRGALSTVVLACVLGTFLSVAAAAGAPCFFYAFEGYVATRAGMAVPPAHP